MRRPLEVIFRLRVTNDVSNRLKMFIVGDDRVAAIDECCDRVRDVAGIFEAIEHTSMARPLSARHQREDLPRQGENFLKRRLAVSSARLKAWRVVDGKHVHFMQRVKRRCHRQQTLSDFGKEFFHVLVAGLFDRLGEGIDGKNRGVDVKQLFGSHPLLWWPLTRRLQSFVMGQNSLETCLSGTVKQDGRRFTADIFSKLLQIHHNNRLSA